MICDTTRNAHFFRNLENVSILLYNIMPFFKVKWISSLLYIAYKFLVLYNFKSDPKWLGLGFFDWH